MSALLPIGTDVKVTPFPITGQHPYEGQVAGYDIGHTKYRIARKVGSFLADDGIYWAFPAEVRTMKEAAVRTFEIPVAGEVTVEIDDAGIARMVCGLSTTDAYIISDDDVAFDPESGEWLSIGQMNDADEIPGGFDALELAQDELYKAVKALAGLRALHEWIEPDEPDSGPSAADTCDALYDLMGSIGLMVP